MSAEDVIKEVNDNSNLPFPLTLSEYDLEYGDEYSVSYGFGGYALEKDGIWISISGWPDVLDGYHITEYRVTSSDYHIFNISVGDQLATVQKALKKNGYVFKKFDGGFAYVKGRAVKITLRSDADDRAVNEIWVAAVTTNKENVDF